MTEVSVSARIPDDVFRELESFMKEEALEKSASIRKLLAEGLQHWKERRALKSLEEGIIWIKSEKFISSDIKKALQ